MSRRFFPERHLDSPILTVPFDRVCQYRRLFDPESGTLDIRTVGPADVRALAGVTALREMTHKEYSTELLDLPNLDPGEYPTFFSLSGGDADRCQRHLALSDAAIRPIIHGVERAWADRIKYPAPSPDEIKLSGEVDNWYTIESGYADLVESYIESRNSGRQDPIRITNKSFSGLFGTSLVVFFPHEYPQLSRVMTYHQLLMLRDCALIRRNVMLGCCIVYNQDPRLIAACKASWAWQEQCLVEYGNEGYELAKSTEALSKTYLGRIVRDPMSGIGDSFDDMLVKLRLKEDSIRFKTFMPSRRPESLADLYFRDVLLPVEEPYIVVELFGLQKCCGHPLIDPRVGGVKAAAEARDRDHTLHHSTSRVRRVFRRLFIDGFIRRNRRWPRLSFLAGGTALERLYNSQVTVLQRRAYEDSDLDYIVFHKEFDVNPYPDFTDLLDDKAISLGRSDKHTTWDGGKPKTHQRLLLEILSRKHYSIHDALEKLDTDSIPEEWKIVSLYPKEREFKLKARMFGMLYPDLRQAFACLEGNIAESLLPLFPQITMTDDKLSVHRRFLQLTSQRPESQYVTIQVEVDLSAWNLRWREQTVEAVGTDFCRLFGVRHLFSSTHKFFKESLMMVRVLGARPDMIQEDHPPEQDLLWYDHLGGIEGQAQKKWSILTVCMIEMALEDTVYRYTMTEQGDNVILTVSAPRDLSMSLHDQMVSMKDDVLHRCEVAAASVNQLLKPEESVAASSVVTYSKVVYANGVHFPTTLKDLFKTSPVSAIDFPSYGAYIGSIFATAYSASENAWTPERCYYVALLQTALYILDAPYHPGPYGRSLRGIECLRSQMGIRLQCLIPSEAGGFPIVGPYAFTHKGGADPLSKSLASLQLLQDYVPECKMIIGLIESGALFSDSPDLLSLIKDPFGLPIRKPQNPSESASNETREVLKEITKNVDVKMVLDAATKDYEEALVESLRSLTPFNPTVAHDIYDASILGSAEAIGSMFLKTRTLQAAARRMEEYDIIETFVQAGQKEISHMANMIYSASEFRGSIADLFELVTNLRSLWGRCGVVPVGITAYEWLDFEITTDRSDQRPGIELEVSRGPHDPRQHRGRFTPYLGFATKEKRSDKGFKILGDGAGVAALKTLHRVIAWADKDSKLVDLVDILALSRGMTKMSSTPLAQASIVGGSVGHRYKSRMSERGAYALGYTNMASHCKISTDHCGYLSGSPDDYPVMFQAAMVYMLSIAEKGDRHGQPSPLSYFKLIMGDKPLHLIPNDPLRMTAQPSIPPLYIDSPLVRVTNLQIRRVAGPLWESVIPIRQGAPEDLLFSSAVEVLLRCLRGHSRTLGVLDHAIEELRLPIGVAETIGIGADRLIEAASHAVLRSAQAIQLSPAYQTRFSRHVEVVIGRYARVLSRSLIKTIFTPLLETDSTLERIGLSAGLSFISVLSADRLLLAEIIRRVHKLITNPASSYYSTPIGVFGDSPSNSTSSAVIDLLRREATRAAACGFISDDVASFMVGSTIRQAHLKEHSTEIEAIVAIREALMSFDKRKMGKADIPQVACDMARRVALSIGESQILATSCTAEEVLRLYRGRSAPVVRSFMSTDLAVETPGQVHRVPLGVRGPITVARSDDKIRYRIACRRGIHTGYGLVALRMWHPTRFTFRDRTVVIIGSGLGGAAVAASRGGALVITGLDLERDIPEETITKYHVPPLLKILKCRRCYIQASETTVAGGDWFCSDVSDPILTRMDNTHVLVIDLPESCYVGRSPLRRVVALSCPAYILVRLRMTETLAVTVENYIDTFFDVDQRYSGFRCYGYVDDILGMRLRSKPRRVAQTLRVFNGGTDVTGETGYPGLHTVLTHLTAPLGVLRHATIRDTLLEIIEVFFRLHTEPISRPSGRDWTDILVSTAAADLLLRCSASEFAEAVVNIKHRGEYLILGRPDSLVLYGPELYRILTTVAPCLIGHLDLEL